jgi:PRC-barrel domain
MPKRIALLATAAALAAMPALAQQSTSPTSPDPSAKPAQTTPAQPEPSAKPAQTTPAQPSATMPSTQSSKSFVESQSSDQWLGSTLIGLKVMGPGDESIGSISDLLVDKDGKVIAAVVGVGGFLGIGKKNVAVPFESLNLSRNPDGNEQATVKLAKTELEKAPDFKPYEPPRPAARAPSGPGSTSPSGPKKGM